MARSSAESVGESSFCAVAVSPAPSAARIFLTIVRTAVRLARFTALRRSVCRIRFNTDFFFFLIFVGIPAGIGRSFSESCERSRVSDAHQAVKFTP